MRDEPNKKELDIAYEKVKDIHRDYLLIEKVRLPKRETAQGYWLAILIYYDKEWVHKDLISDITRKYIDVATDQQVRHLKRAGWNLESDESGQHRIQNPYQTHPSFAKNLIKSQRILTAGDFQGIKEAFGNKCATCGAREGQPDPRYGEAPVKLQEGHKDPEKPINNKNIIPQCQFCNRSYKNDFTFDDKGRVRAIASPKPVLRASKEVQKQVRNVLNDKSRE